MYLLEKSSSSLGLMQLLSTSALSNIFELAQILLVVHKLLLDVRQHIVLPDEGLTFLLAEGIDGLSKC